VRRRFFCFERSADIGWQGVNVLFICKLFYTTVILFVRTSGLETNIEASVYLLNPCSSNGFLRLLLDRLSHFVHFKSEPDS
jgi:hypothetical protein